MIRTVSLILILVVGFLVAGCGFTRGGAGQTTTGEPLVGEIWQNNSLEQGFTITSVNGWQCNGRLSREQAADTASSVYTVPLECSGGVTGTSLVAVDRLRGEVDINFRLSNGTVGQLAVS